MNPHKSRPVVGELGKKLGRRSGVPAGIDRDHHATKGSPDAAANLGFRSKNAVDEQVGRKTVVFEAQPLIFREPDRDGGDGLRVRSHDENELVLKDVAGRIDRKRHRRPFREIRSVGDSVIFAVARVGGNLRTAKKRGRGFGKRHEKKEAGTTNVPAPNLPEREARVTSSA